VSTRYLLRDHLGSVDASSDEAGNLAQKGRRMKRRRFTEEQIIGVLYEHGAGMEMSDLALKHGSCFVGFWF
jgi:hypothetical protein